MRLGIWAYTVAVGFASLAVAAMGGIFANVIHSFLGNKPLPVLTAFVVDFHRCALALPLPWLIAAIVLSRREAATPSRCFAFAGISTFAITFLFAFTAISFALPYVRIMVCMSH